MARIPSFAQIPSWSWPFLVVAGLILSPHRDRTAVRPLGTRHPPRGCASRSRSSSSVAFGSVLVGGRRRRRARRADSSCSTTASRAGRGYLFQLIAFLTPAVLLLLVGLIFPSIKTFIASFMNSAGNKFIGLDNFVWVFTQPDGIRVVVNTIVWVLVVPTVSTVVGLAYAVFIDAPAARRSTRSWSSCRWRSRSSAPASSGSSSTTIAGEQFRRSAC